MIFPISCFSFIISDRAEKISYPQLLEKGIQTEFQAVFYLDKIEWIC